ncbi:DUF1490 family protein [Mycobacterium saskatchewanense]|uniref:DUF1490 family protein n=1 Tax=Mycobacterium saskatchewanense TaxID=220927 RepID=A0AAJ3TXX9_9MYCO|nr:DUF1490 family protein [Mycobacterium saskatchewanense]ORW73732.1 hypothetical protein AWC23_06200 [Mycobacterium saskatchewanense]
MAVHGLVAKAAPVVVTGVVGAVAYEAARKVVAKAPLRKATIVVTAWGMRVAREAERKAGESAEQARLTVADVMAEARERAGEGAPLVTVAGSGDSE